VTFNRRSNSRPVEKPGERIVAREVRQPGGVLALAAHVVKHEHRTDDVRRTVANRSNAVVDRDGCVVATTQDNVAFRLDDAPLAQRAFDRIGDLHSGVLVAHGEGERQHAAARASIVPARQAFGHRIHELDLAGHVDGDDSVRNRCQRDLSAFLLLEDLRFRMLALGDVRQRPRHSLRFSLGPEHRASASPKPSECSALDAHAELEIERLAAPQVLAQTLRRRTAIVRVNPQQERRRGFAHRPAFVPHQLFETRREVKLLASERPVPEAVIGCNERIFETLLARAQLALELLAFANEPARA
jgi:hypothetical protein